MEFLSLTYIIKEYRDREYVIKVVLCSNFIIYSIFRFIVYFQSTNTTGAHKCVVKSRVSCGRHTTGQTRSESPTSRKKKKEERLLLYSGNNNNRRSIRLLPVPRISTNPRISSRCRSLLVWGFVQLGLRHDN